MRSTIYRILSLLLGKPSTTPPSLPTQYPNKNRCNIISKELKNILCKPIIYPTFRIIQVAISSY